MVRALAGLLAACLLSAPSAAFAHGGLESSVPASGATLSTAPTELRLVFTEVAELAFTRVELRGSVLTCCPLPPSDSRADCAGPLSLTPQTRDTIDSEVQRIVTTQYERAQRLLTEHRAALASLTKQLLTSETLDGSVVRQAIAPRPMAAVS